MTRRGKIARLPRALRDELNQRIEDGETGARIVEWLNGREDVQELLKIHFSGRPINEQNVSDWRAGGYADWQEQQATFELANGLMDEAADRKDIMTEDGRLADHVGDMAALMLAKMIRALRRMDDGPEQWETALKVVREVVRLRRSDREYEQERRRRETQEHYAAQDWQRTRAGFEAAEEKVDQLIMRKLVAAGRGRLEDIPEDGRPGTEGRGRRTEDRGRSTSTITSTRREEGGEQRTEDRDADGGGASPAAQDAEAGKFAQASKPGVAGETTGVCKTDALQEGTSQASVVPAVPQEPSRSIKVDRRSDTEERWVGPWKAQWVGR